MWFKIYQYVGDEPVICWDYEKGVKEICLYRLLFRISKKSYLTEKIFYENEFGLIPEFKAGMHGGELVVPKSG